jgi:hypothetical protein
METERKKELDEQRTIIIFQANSCLCSKLTAGALYASYIALTQLWSTWCIKGITGHCRMHECTQGFDYTGVRGAVLLLCEGAQTNPP